MRSYIHSCFGSFAINAFMFQMSSFIHSCFGSFAINTFMFRTLVFGSFAINAFMFRISSFTHSCFGNLATCIYALEFRMPQYESSKAPQLHCDTLRIWNISASWIRFESAFPLPQSLSELSGVAVSMFRIRIFCWLLAAHSWQAVTRFGHPCWQHYEKLNTWSTMPLYCIVSEELLNHDKLWIAGLTSPMPRPERSAGEI